MALFSGIPLPESKSIFDTMTDNQKIQNSLSQQSLANKKQEIENSFAPEKNRADIDYTTANTNKINTMTPLEAVAKQLENQWYAKKAQAQINAENSLAANREAGGSGSGGLGTGAKESLFLLKTIKDEHPDWNPNKIREYADGQLSGNNTFSDGSQMPEATGLVRESLNRVVKAGSDVQGRNQQRSAAVLDQLLSQGDKLMPSVSEYAGLAGKAGQSADALNAATGGNNPKYRDFQIFTTQIVPQLANQMLLTEGGRATDQQKSMMVRVANPVFWNSNPQQALQEWRYLTNTFKNVSNIVSKSNSEIRGGLRNQGNGNNKDNDPLGIR